MAELNSLIFKIWLLLIIQSSYNPKGLSFKWKQKPFAG